MKKSIKNRESVFFLVDTFYNKIRKDDLLGSIFNGMITDWDTHLEHLTNFWCSQLFIERSYEGNPIEAHRKVDAFANYKID